MGIRKGGLWWEVLEWKLWMLMKQFWAGGKIHCPRWQCVSSALHPFCLLLWWCCVVCLKMWICGPHCKWHGGRGPHSVWLQCTLWCYHQAVLGHSNSSKVNDVSPSYFFCKVKPNIIYEDKFMQDCISIQKHCVVRYRTTINLHVKRFCVQCTILRCTLFSSTYSCRRSFTLRISVKWHAVGLFHLYVMFFRNSPQCW